MSAGADVIGALIGFILTLLVFSYVIGDNPLFRMVTHIFVGVAVGYAVVLSWYSVIWPQMLLPLVVGSNEARLALVVPILLALLLLFKVSSRFSAAGSLPLAYLVAVGAATAIGGAVLGTLFPQIAASVNLFDLTTPDGQSVLLDLLEGGIVLIGAVSTLAYFHFGARPRPDRPPQRSPFIEFLAGIGKYFIAIALGAIFAGVLAASLSALVERITFLVDFLLPILSML